MRVAVGNDELLPLSVYDGDELSDPDALPSVTVFDEFGEEITVGAVTAGDEPGIYTAKLGSLTSPTLLTVEWIYVVGGMTRMVRYPVNVDGAYLFEIADLRRENGLSDLTKYPIDLLKGARDGVTEFFNDFTQTAFVPTYGYQVVDGRQGSRLFLRGGATDVLKLIVDGVEVVTSGLTVVNGLVRSTSAFNTYSSTGQNVKVGYLYGFKYVPADVRRAAIMCARTWLLDSNGPIPDRARMMTTQWATFQLSTASDDYPTGIPSVDSVLRRYKLWIPSFA